MHLNIYFLFSFSRYYRITLRCLETLKKRWTIEISSNEKKKEGATHRSIVPNIRLSVSSNICFEGKESIGNRAKFSTKDVLERN